MISNVLQIKNLQKAFKDTQVVTLVPYQFNKGRFMVF